uniref:Uncharacterized protein n=1 Tax=Arundo donax TaxID=35708 RepID=A0A0A8ZYR3_ARUDO
MVLTNWGATILAVRLPDKNGQCLTCSIDLSSSSIPILGSDRWCSVSMAAGHIDDVVLGYKDIGSYVVSS